MATTISQTITRSTKNGATIVLNKKDNQKRNAQQKPIEASSASSLFGDEDDIIDRGDSENPYGIDLLKTSYDDDDDAENEVAGSLSKLSSQVENNNNNNGNVQKKKLASLQSNSDSSKNNTTITKSEANGISTKAIKKKNTSAAKWNVSALHFRKAGIRRILKEHTTGKTLKKVNKQPGRSVNIGTQLSSDCYEPTAMLIAARMTPRIAYAIINAIEQRGSRKINANDIQMASYILQSKCVGF